MVLEKVSVTVLGLQGRGILSHGGRALDLCDLSKTDRLLEEAVRDGLAEIVVNEVKRHG